MESKRIIVIGDIHNSYLALVELMEKIKPTKEDLFIFLGDYVDGWNDTIRTLNYLMEFSRTYNCVRILGNHDSEWGLLGFLKTGRPERNWLHHGGLVTYDAIVSEMEDNPGFIDELTQWLESCVPYYIDEQNRLFVHGGFSSAEGVEADIKENGVSNLYWDRLLLAKAMNFSLNDKKFHLLNLYSEIYIGHTSTTSMDKAPVYANSLLDPSKPLTVFNLTNMDTGAGWEGKLSAMDINTRQVWQSSKVLDLYKEYDKQHYTTIAKSMRR